ncbi:MAG: phosphoribosylaminoimidazolesuccinocarboxamide synthase [Chitinivibrionales bacterium]|nr:phosphoribosylaminoimidazolesuccinocarboxamide synthase [Chitinivibrionales bacterium]
MAAIMEKSIKQLSLLARGKVRDVYDIGDDKHLLMIATDRISAFDRMLPTPIPGKGKMLTKMSNFWFDKTRHIVRNHSMGSDLLLYLWETKEYPDLSERSVVVCKAEKLPIEAIVRGYIAGSGWKEYCSTGSICGIKLPVGLKESDQLPEPIFTPSTKEEHGKNDENITFDKAARIVGRSLAERIRETSLRLYQFASQVAKQQGLIIADTKFEFGLIDNELVLIDELFTSDSSRFWPIEKYRPGRAQKCFDKQYVRDYLDSIKWDHSGPAPELPPTVVQSMSEKYCSALKVFDIQVETANPLAGIC